MDTFFSLSSQQTDPQDVITDCIQQLAEAPAGYNFGFIYVTDTMSEHLEQLIARCKATSGINHWIGTSGVGIVADSQEIYESPAASLMLAQFDADNFFILENITDSEELARTVKQYPAFQTHFGIVHGDPFNKDIQSLITGLQLQLDNGFLTGGLTSSRDKHYQIADDIVSGGLSGAIFSENIAVQTNLTQGCSPYGPKHKITLARDNIAIELDDMPALDVLMQDLGIDDTGALVEHAQSLFTGLCIKGSDKSDYTVRNLVGADIEHKAFAINDQLEENGELLFCTRNAETARQDMHHMLEKLASRIDHTPRGGIYVSCLGRGREQFGEDSEEIRMIQEVLGDFPLSGFFANGEIHHAGLYGYTGVLTLFL